jgi:hypothetical protein
MPTDLVAEILVDGAILHTGGGTVDCDLVLTEGKESPREWNDGA